MSAVSIRVENLGKQYRIGKREQHNTLRDTIIHVVRAPLRRLSSPDATDSEATIWALKDVSFEVKQGAVVGIVGRNGAGKSTLLKILSRITEPTVGHVRIRGRVASLLEVGTGFHAELTGRENIYLNGAILGMKRNEITHKFDEIVTFAEVEKFIDTPVKHYSSGMYLRLAFAVAAHLEPEILLVDEVLAVGDAAFQKKCLGKMGDVAREGRTILFVSHNLAAVRALCRYSIYLDVGEIAGEGETQAILNLYSKVGLDSIALNWVRPTPATGESNMPEIRVLAVRLVGMKDPIVPVDTPFQIAIDFIIEREPSFVIPGIHLRSSEGLVLMSSADWSLGRLEPGCYTSICEIPAFLLGEGRIIVSAFLHNSERPGANDIPVDSVTSTISIEIDVSAWAEVTHNRWLRPWPGLVRPRFLWHTTSAEPIGGQVLQLTV